VSRMTDQEGEMEFPQDSFGDHGWITGLRVHDFWASRVKSVAVGSIACTVGAHTTFLVGLVSDGRGDGG
jgi:hypothetical protein